MTPGKYEELAMRSQANQMLIGNRLADLDTKAHLQLIQLRNGVTGLTDEVGELNSCVKKYVEYGQILDIPNIQEEIGDCLWRLVQICQAVGYTLEQAMIHNIEKLKIRYPNGYTDFHAAEENRDRAAERQLLAEPLNYPVPPFTYKVENGKVTGQQTGQGFAEPSELCDFGLKDLVALCNQPCKSNKQAADELRRRAIEVGYTYTETCAVDTWEQVAEMTRNPKLKISPQLIATEIENAPVSFGDGLSMTGTSRQLNHSYNRYCSQCQKMPVHQHSLTGVCPDCAADIRAGRRSLVTKE